MWKQKIGISIGSSFSIPISDVIALLKRIGFDAVSPSSNSQEVLEEIAISAKENGIILQSLHAPFDKAANLWSDDLTVSTPVKEEMFSSIDLCAQFGIPVVVMHVWIGFDYEFKADSLNFKNFDEIVSYANKNNVKIAFENTEGEEFLFALMNHFEDNETVGFCWDSGHEMCYNRSEDLLAKFGDRLIMTHLNDNLGISRFDGRIFWTDDLHLLPYDGIADWDINVERLKKSNELEVLNFELNKTSKPDRHDNDVYTEMSLERYFTEAYKRACKIAYKYSK